MNGKYPRGMTCTQWRRTPFRIKHGLIGLAINDALRHWRACRDRSCRRARACQGYTCYWRRLEPLPFAEQMRARKAAEPLAKLLWIGSGKGSEGRPLY
jgi:hypothetical protein